MKTNSKSTVIIHPILFAIFPIVFLFSNNIHELKFQEIFLPLLLILPIVIGLWILLRYILKNALKAGFIVSILLVVFFSYGHIYELFDTITIGDVDIGKSRYLLIPILISLVAGIYYFIRTNRKLNNATTITNFITIALILTVSINIGIFYTESKDGSFENSFLEIESEQTVSSQLDSDNLPDIYYILLDGYAGKNALKEFLDFDNQEFYSFLNNKGFYVPEQTYGNYPITPTSMATVLNMQYPHHLADLLGSESADLHPTFEIIYDNLVMKKLKSNGYTIINFETGADYVDEFKNLDLYYCKNDSLLEHKLTNALLHTSIIGYFVDRIEYQEHRNRILCSFSELPQIKNIDEPTFVYAHMVIPHIPYVFTAEGEPRDPINRSDSQGDQDVEGYLNQVKFTNMEIQKVINQLLYKTNEPPIIIIQSDHGSDFGLDWKNVTEDALRQRMSNFQAFYLPNENSDLMSKASTPVNIFRIIFNLYFDGNYEMLPDKVYWNDYYKPYDFKDVTSILISD